MNLFIIVQKSRSSPPLRTSLRRMSTDPVYPSTSGGGTTDTTNNDNDNSNPSVSEAAYIAAASVACNEEFRASVSSRNMAAKSVSSRRSLMLNSPVHYNLEGETTTETTDDLQEAWKELTSGGSGKESYATSAIQASINGFCMEHVMMMYTCSHFHSVGQDYSVYSGRFLSQIC